MKTRLAIVWFAVVLPQFTAAHQLNYSYSELHWRVDKQVLEVTHSIHMDDAVVLLAHLGDFQARLDIESQAKLLFYVEQKFSLQLGDEVLQLDPIGAQVDGDNLWIYQEIAMEKFPAGLVVHCTLMQDVFPTQTNQVNFTIGDEVRTGIYNSALTHGVLVPRE